MVMNALAVSPTELVAKLAEALKSVPEIQAPVWVLNVKSSAHTERVPQQENYWFMRCAALLRTISLNSKAVGVQRLRHKFGGRQVHVVSKSHHVKAGGKGIRLALQQLEKAGLIKKEKAGRVLSPAGRKFIEKTAKELTSIAPVSSKPSVPAAVASKPAAA
ncbi:40S ribosomal protein S19 [Candidatus Micrarchaeota archaeon]|nr:40S ribosomal protein S19 [Candidatus Micrarchaeota archaeon]